MLIFPACTRHKLSEHGTVLLVLNKRLHELVMAFLLLGETNRRNWMAPSHAVQVSSFRRIVLGDYHLVLLWVLLGGVVQPLIRIKHGKIAILLRLYPTLSPLQSSSHL